MTELLFERSQFAITNIPGVREILNATRCHGFLQESERYARPCKLDMIPEAYVGRSLLPNLLGR